MGAKHINLILFVATFVAACGADKGIPTRSEGPISVASTPEGKDGKSQQSGDSQNEGISPPVNVTASYLICEELVNVEADPRTATIQCALRDTDSNTKVDLVGDFNFYAWGFEKPANADVTVDVIELNDDPEWHGRYTLRGESFDDVELFKRSPSFTLQVEDKLGAPHQFKAGLPEFSLRWAKSNGGAVPSNAIIGGNQGADDLYICRSYIKGQVIPGRLVAKPAGTAKSTCYTTFEGQSNLSTNQNSGRILQQSDVLVLESGNFAELWEWVPGSDGQRPTLGLMSGLDAAGEPIYSCRTQENGENIVGYLREGAKGCTYESQGEKVGTKYEVLAWKSSAVKDMFERIDQ